MKHTAAYISTSAHIQEEADGLTMPGSSASNTLAIQTALTSLFPTFRKQGTYGIIFDLIARGRSAQGSRPLIFTGQEGHYSIDKAAMACGLGLDSVIAVPCKDDDSMDPVSLEGLMTQAFDGGQGYPFFLNVTAGSTVMGSFDALDQIADVCARVSSRQSASIWLHGEVLSSFLKNTVRKSAVLNAVTHLQFARTN